MSHESDAFMWKVNTRHKFFTHPVTFMDEKHTEWLCVQTLLKRLCFVEIKDKQSQSWAQCSQNLRMQSFIVCLFTLRATVSFSITEEDTQLIVSLFAMSIFKLMNISTFSISWSSMATHTNTVTKASSEKCIPTTITTTNKQRSTSIVI